MDGARHKTCPVLLSPLHPSCSLTSTIPTSIVATNPYGPQPVSNTTNIAHSLAQHVSLLTFFTTHGNDNNQIHFFSFAALDGWHDRFTRPHDFS